MRHWQHLSIYYLVPSEEDNVFCTSIKNILFVGTCHYLLQACQWEIAKRVVWMTGKGQSVTGAKEKSRGVRGLAGFW